MVCLCLECLFFLHTDFHEESNGYSVLSEGQDNEPSDSQRNEGCVHSSEDDEQDPKQDYEEDGSANESQVATHDSSGSRPLLLDSEEDEPEDTLAPHSTAQCSTLPIELSSTYHQPQPSTLDQNHCQRVYVAPTEQDVATDIFLKAPFRIAQEDISDVFANAPFPRPPAAAQRQDVFAQAPFGKRKEATGVPTMPAQPNTLYPHAATTPEQGILGNVAQQPFRPQALAKYSRHFEGTVPHEPVTAHRVVSNVSSQAAVGSVPVGPLHSWTSEINTVDPFVSAPFHLKAPQEKP